MLHRLFVYIFKHQVILGLFLIGLVFLVYQLRDILLSLFLSYIIMSAVLPVVAALRRWGIPKILAVLIPYIAIICAIVLLIAPLVPFAIAQITALAVSFPQLLDRSAENLGFNLDPKQLHAYFNGQIDSLGKNAITVTTRVFGGVFSVLTIFIVSFYWLMYHDSFKKFVAHLFAPRLHDDVLETIDKVNEKLGAWLRGQMFLSAFIGLMTWIVLTLIGLPYALPLALLAGLLEVVPTLGPILSAIPAVIIGFTISPTMALIVVGAYILIQATENHILVPNVMQKAVGLNPVIVILSIIIGANLMGIAGALLSIPLVSFTVLIFQHIEAKTNK